MATIDDLWDEPVESEPAPHLVENPATSTERPLFLQSDSENEETAGTAGSRPSKAPDDIGALFDIDDDDENGQLSNVTYEQLRKDALSGGQVPDDGSSGGEGQGTKEGSPKEGSTAKSKSNEKGEDGSTKRTIPKLNEELLLGEKGIPALIKDAKRWRPKGKGHEVNCFYQSHRLRLCGLIGIVRLRTSIVSFGHTNIGLTRCTLGTHSAIPLKGSRD